MPLTDFHPSVKSWFAGAYGAPTEVQSEAWPAIHNNRYTLIAAPTGSGKTLAAFLIAIDEIIKQGIEGSLLPETQVVYVSPLKALGNDIERNLRDPLAGISGELEKQGFPSVQIKAAVRTGDTTASERTAMIKTPPHILVTTPESLYLLLTSDNGRKMLSNVNSVIVDEIHALADDKRGSHLSLSLERLENLVNRPLKRIGLSATQKPIENIAAFLTGNRNDVPCNIIDTTRHRDYDLGMILPYSPLSSLMSNEIWTEVYQKLASLIIEHETTLIFVNTRRLAERLTYNLYKYIGKDVISSHHGSMSKKHREEAEQQLKNGKLKAIVATASLELGIDIGSVDLVVQIGSPRRISTFIQRLGRSRHFVNGIPKGRIVPLTLSDLLECTALLDAIQRNELDKLHIPEKPLDVLAQQIVAELSCRDYGYNELYNLFLKAYPYRELLEKEYSEIIETLSKGYTTRKGRSGAYIFYDKVNGWLKARKAARLTALLNGGTIPDNFDYNVVLEPENNVIGTVNEDFAMESLPGDVFQLGNNSWRIAKIGNGKIRVEDALGQPPGIPFWLGEAPGRSNELSVAVSRLIRNISEMIPEEKRDKEIGINWLKEHFHFSEKTAEQLVEYILFTRAALGDLPGTDTVIMERFFDEAGDMHLVIHSMFGMRLNKAWGLALRKRFCRKFNFELQAAANENSIVLSLGPTHSFPLQEVFSYLNTNTVREILTQALFDSPLFGIRWRWNISTALALPRRRGGKKIPAQIQRMQAEDLASLIFPDQLACLENIAGDREIPDHPLVNQTIYDCLHEAMDIEKLEELINNIQLKQIKTIAVDVKEPSPMAQDILTAQPYAFLDNAPLEERRVRAVYTRRWSTVEEAAEMAKLDPLAIRKVKDEIWPRVRNADELYEGMMIGGFFTEKEIGEKEEMEKWLPFFNELTENNRATLMSHPQHQMCYWVAVERLVEFRKVFSSFSMSPEIPIPENIQKASGKIDDPLIELLRSRLEISGPVTIGSLSEIFPVNETAIEQALLTLENEGFVLRGHFNAPDADEWCERRLLARIHRYTINKLRSAIQAVSPAEFMNYLFHHHKLLPGEQKEGPQTVGEVLDMLEGYEAQSVAWEGDIFPSRIMNYSYTWLDLTLMTGEYIWGRFKHGRQEAGLFSTVPIRTTPITFIRRENLRYRQAEIQTAQKDTLSVYAKIIYQLLQDQGALFFYQLEEKSELLKSQVEDALIEMISVGIITSDSYTGLRTLLIPDKYYTEKRKAGKIVFNLQQAGRWWIIPSIDEEKNNTDHEDYLHSIAVMLLKRYGIVFRKLAEKERLLWCWYDLLKIYRRMEARGTIRGGRFVDGIGGEQYALPEAVTQLREFKKEQENTSDSYISISAADPLNLTGFITPGKRVPGLYSNRILYSKGSPVAIKEGKEVTFVNDEDEETKWKLKKLLIRRDVQPELRPYLIY